MSPDFCDVDAKFMMRLLDGYTYSIGCAHRTIAIVTIQVADDITCLSFLLEDQVVDFLIEGRGITKSGQSHYPSSIPPSYPGES